MIEPKKFYQDVSQLCLDRISDSFDPSNVLFSRQLRNMKWESTFDTEDMTSTAICIIGLIRAGMAEGFGVDMSRILDALINVSKNHNYQGGMGLVIWANAVAGGVELNKLMERAGIPDIDIRQFVAPLTTMESSWLLSGLIHEYKRFPDETTKKSLIIVMDEIINRFEKKSFLFHHATDNASIKDRLRKHVANFADQIYSVQALSYAAITLGEEKPFNVAKSCASRLIDHQGTLGQWWWHYNSVSGKVAQHFPVYSVHQYAMAPMALMALTASGGGNFEDIIALSQEWINHNELGVNLKDLQTGTIWRDISPRENSLKKSVRHAMSIFGLQQTDGKNIAPDNLTVNYETRPYEWAWCLFAGAMAEGKTHPSQFVT